MTLKDKSHHFGDPAYVDELKRLFHPGAGKAPPLLAGRAGSMGKLNDSLRYLAAKDSPPADIVIYEPST